MTCKDCLRYESCKFICSVFGCNIGENDAFADKRCNAFEPRPPMTNADRIRAMSDEDMAAEMYCPYMKDIYDECKFGWHTPTQSCFECKLEWLRQPAEDGEG